MTTPSHPLTIPPLLVGRDREQRVLRDRLAAALASHGSLVLIGGEAGIGKTALAETLCREATEQGALVFIGRCYDLTETPPYGPWVELFGCYRQPDAMPPLPAPFAQRGTISAVASQASLFQQVLDFLVEVAGHRPLVLLLDDLHWADPASLDLLRFLARNLFSLPFLLLATYRSEEVAQQQPLYQLLPLLAREAGAERLTLRPLEDASIRSLIGERYDLGDTDAGRLIAQLRARAEGSPLFVGELLRSMEESGTLRRGEAGWTLHELAEATVPPLLRQVIGRRLARLDAERQRLLAIAAIIGHNVPYDVWAALTDPDAVLAVVAEAEAASLMTEDLAGTGASFAHALIRETLYEGTRPSQRRQWHRRCGEILAISPHPDPNTIADHFQRAGDERAVAWLVKAGERAAAAAALLVAADRFEAALAILTERAGNPGERGWLLFRIAYMRRYSEPQRSIAYLEDAGQLARVARDDALATGISGLLGNQHCMVGEVRQGLSELEANVAARQTLPSHAFVRLWEAQFGGCLDEAAADSPALRMLGMAGLAMWYANAGRYADARAFGERYVAEMSPERLPNVIPDAWIAPGRAGAFFGLAITYAALGLPTAAQDAFRQANEAYRLTSHDWMIANGMTRELLWLVLPYQADRSGERRTLATAAEEELARARGTRADLPARFARLPALVLDGAWDEARALAAAGHALSTDFALQKQVASVILGSLALAQGNTDLAWSVVREWLPDGPASTPGNTVFLVATALQRVAAALGLDRGDPGTAKEWLEAHDRWLAWSGAVLGQSEGQALWARYHQQSGNIDTARHHAERALAQATAPRQPLALLAAYRLLGELATDAGRFDDAATHFDASLRLAEACAAPYERALTLLARAELLAATSDFAGATMLLDEIHAISTPLGAKLALARADALAARLGARAGGAPGYPAGLSAREVEVLRLLTQGMSNRAMAAQLFVSARTVERHVRNLYLKIDAHNRADATAFAFRYDLT